MPMSKALPKATISIAGVTAAMSAGNILKQRNTYRMMPSDMRTSMNMAAGVRGPSTARAGSLAGGPRAGPHTATGIGLGFHRGDGRGSMMHRGVLLHSTMAVGL